MGKKKPGINRFTTPHIIGVISYNPAINLFQAIYYRGPMTPFISGFPGPILFCTTNLLDVRLGGIDPDPSYHGPNGSEERA